MRVPVVDVALDPRTGGSEGLFTYRADNPLAVGEAVFVPVGTRSALGFVVRAYDVSAAELAFPIEKLRPVHAVIVGLQLPPELIALAENLAEETLCPISVALAPAIPPSVQDRLSDVWMLVKGAEVKGLTTAQHEVVRVLEEADGEWIAPKSKTAAEGTVKVLKALRTKGIVKHELRFTDPSARRTRERILRLTGDSDRVEAFLKNEGKRKPAQALTLMCLSGSDDGGLTSAEIRAMAGVTESTVKALMDSGLLEPVEVDAPKAHRNIKALNPYQMIAYEAIADAVQNKEYRPFLLFGVTGSGKTEVYLRAAGEALKAGRQVLYLVPEIALAAQAIAQLRDRFGSSVAVLHSELSPTERLQNWLRIRSGEASVVVGARSAIFAPLTNLGLLILDEEHEGSYKQEKAPRYHSKSSAKVLGRLHNCPIVLGSATPSAESFYEAEQEQLELLSLPHRAAEATLPEIEIKDLTVGFRTGKPALLAPELHERMEATLARGEQVILFLNRRAYAPFLVCRDCGHQMRCKECSVSLSFHRRDMRLKCHQCGHYESAPDTCPGCGGSRMSPLGIGTERVEEAIGTSFPDAEVARLDRDVASKKGAIEDVLARFRSGEIHVLVGTQMVAKGLDFPNVTLVGVIAADVSLNLPDFRASERTFQLLSQVAGRAGRGSRPGHVVIQTFNPDHPAVKCAQTHDFVRFYEELREERRDARYPPFCRLVNITFSGENKSHVTRASQEAAQSLVRTMESEEVQILGPTDCALERVQGQWRRHLLVKLPTAASPKPVADAISLVNVPGVQIVLDVDPYTLM